MSQDPVDTMKLEDNAAFMDKYSRQIGAYGLEAMGNLLNMKVLIVGVQGLGMETAKNLTLAGPGAVTLVDDEPVAIADLGANFFLEPSDVGKPRAGCVAPKLQELNLMVAVTARRGAVTEALVAAHSCVVWCNGTRADLLRWDAFCRARRVVFIAAGTLGAAGYVFSDFGDKFTIRDTSGEALATRIITHISNETEAVVTLLGAYGEEGGRLHGLDENDHDGFIEISDVEGMEERDGSGKGINGMGALKIKTCTKKVHVVREKDGKKITEEKDAFDPYRLRVAADTSALTAYHNGGIMTQVKVPVVRSHRPLEETLQQPVPKGEYGLLFTDGTKFGRGEQIHLCLLALWEFQASRERLPQPGSAEEAAEIVALAEKINAHHKSLNKEGEEPTALAVEEIDAAAIKSIALYSALELQPLSAYFGGVVAQEVVKGTGKYSPLNQWLHLDFLEMLPDPAPPEEERRARGTRYDNMLQVYGETFVRERVLGGKTFMVGCGALGCEFLKNFAMIGFACGPGGLITVTDNDRIEVSNLSRQFLFREHNVGQPKSKAAAKAVSAMNADIQVDAKEALVALQTENLFPDQFWEGIDFVTNALDNVKARLYVDSRCVFYGKPLLESGTLGTKCNVQVVVPHVTASYGDGPKDQEDEDNIPMCTLRNFPSLIEHCIEWARAQFEDGFVAPFAEAKKFAADKQGYLAQVRAGTLDNPDRAKAASAIVKELENLTALRNLLDKAQGMTFERCISEAFARFHDLYRSRILQLTHNFPEDHVTDGGEKFWTGAKRFPQAAVLDTSNEDHMMFVTSCANILAAAYGLVRPPEEELLPKDHEYRDRERIAKVVASLDVPMWEPSGEKIVLDEGKQDEKKDDADAMDVGDAPAELAALIDQLAAVDTSKLRFEPASFEKDQDLNFHIDFVAATANMRAWNYRIKTASRHKIKMIAGKIIPALATTTASVCGLVMIELLKVLQKKGLEAYKDSSNNLGLNSYFFSEPAPPEKATDKYDEINMAFVKCVPPGYTKWHKTIVDRGDLTMRQFLDAFKETTGLNIALLFHAVSEIDGPQRGLMLYDAEAWSQKLKDLYKSKMDANFRDWVSERYAEAPMEIMLPTRKYVELQVMCTDDEDQPYKVPAVVYRWAH